MAPKSPAAAASGSASDASDGDAGADNHSRRRRVSPFPLPSGSRSRSRSPSRSRSRSKTPPPNLRPNAAALSSTPTSAGAEFAAASDSDADAGAAGRVRERSPRSRSDSDADAAARTPPPRRGRGRGRRRPRSDYDSDNSAAGAGTGAALPLIRERRSSRIETSNIKPASASHSKRRSKRRPSPPERGTPEYQKRTPRVWSPEDEITILNALIQYRDRKGRLPASIQDTSKVHNQIRGKLTATASTTQLSDKVRRLKHKFKVLVTRAKNGRVPEFPTDHDRDVYELSMKVWGSKSGGVIPAGGSRAGEDAADSESHEEPEIEESDDGMESGWERNNRTSKKPKASRFENGNSNAIVLVDKASHGNGGGRHDPEKGKQLYPYLWEAVEELSKEHPSGPIFRKAFAVLEKSKARAMEEKLRKFRMTEVRQQLGRMDLMKETVGMVLDALDGAY